MIRQGETVRWQCGDNLGHALFEKGLYLMEVVNRMKLRGSSDECVEQLRNTIAINLLSTIVFARISGYNADLPLMKWMYRVMKKPMLVLVVYFPLMLLPTNILMIPVWVAKTVKNRE